MIKTIAQSHSAVMGERLCGSGRLEFGRARAQRCKRPVSGDIAAFQSILVRVSLVPVSCHDHKQRLCFASYHLVIILTLITPINRESYPNNGCCTVN